MKASEKWKISRPFAGAENGVEYESLDRGHSRKRNRNCVKNTRIVIRIVIRIGNLKKAWDCAEQRAYEQNEKRRGDLKTLALPHFLLMIARHESLRLMLTPMLITCMCPNPKEAGD